jgi:hypothetical protein
MGIIGSLAGLPLQQSRGSDLEASRQNAAIQARRISAARQSEAAAGVGETEQDQEVGERDADGRRLWEHSPRPSAEAERPSAGEATTASSRDASGESGANLDLSG